MRESALTRVYGHVLQAPARLAFFGTPYRGELELAGIDTLRDLVSYTESELRALDHAVRDYSKLEDQYGPQTKQVPIFNDRQIDGIKRTLERLGQHLRKERQ